MVKCTYEKCYKQFPTVRDMQCHKRTAPEHDYCARCDEDCADDYELHVHKMISSKHISCPVCAFDFKSEGGREEHIKQAHPRDQQLACPGCSIMFTRATNLMSHIEKGECKAINVEEFEARRAKKQVLRAHFENGLSSNPFAMSRLADNRASDLLSEMGGVALGEAGGVSLLEEMDNEDVRSHISKYTSRCSQMSSDMGRPSLPGSMTSSQKWPSLPGVENQRPGTGGTRILGTAPITEDLLEFPDLKISDGEGESPVEATKVPQKSFAAATGASSVFSALDDRPASTAASISNWEEETDGGRSTAVSHFTDLSNYDVNKFFDPFEAKYRCPSEHCDRSFGTAKKFNEHLLSAAHVGGATRCPGCFRTYRSSTALIAHMESQTKRCSISQSGNYNQLLREISGGLVGTHGHHPDGSLRYVTPKAGLW